jgi:polyhydroxyalkanoate synthesis repressor PhaR
MTIMSNPAEKPAAKQEPVVVKKYANRRLYNTETSSYVTLDDLAAMVKIERDFVVYDAKSGDDLTHSVLTQIIVEQESNRGADTMLPVPFLRQLIRFYGDSIEKMVPSYLQISLDSLTKDQDKFRKQFSTVLTPAGAIEAYQEQARKNLALFEQAMGMFSPFKPLGPLGNPMAGPLGNPMAGVMGAMGQAGGQAGGPPGGQQAAAAVPPTAAGANAKSTGSGAKVQPSPPAAPAPTAAAKPDVRQDEMAEMKRQMAAMQAMMEKLSRDKT